MPRDKRLYMTFPNGFWMHPKIKPLSDNAFRVFVEINGYSRLEDLDGRVPVALAQSTWKKRSLDELCANHAERSSLSIEGTDYVIWNYAEHQLIRADREEESARNSVNGRKGGRPKKSNRTETDPLSGGQAGKSQSQESESESELNLTDISRFTESSHLRNGSDSGLDSTSEIIQLKAKHLGINNLAAVRTKLEDAAHGQVSIHGALILADAILSKAKREVRDVDAYLATVCRTSAAEVQQAYFDLDIEGAAS